MLSARGVRPTYLISYPVATSPLAIEVLGGYRASGLCEIGTHVHPWNTPPLEEERTAHNSYISNLPPSLQFKKIEALHHAIARNFGAAPTSYRSGKWGFSDDVARNLIRLGYAIDTSRFPAWDWSPGGGPDYTSCTLEPFIYRLERGTNGPGGSLLEIPATVDYVQRRRRLANSAYWTIRKRVPAADRVLALLNRTGLLNHVCVSPEINSAAQMIRLARALADRGTKIVNMFFHSPSLLPGCSPFVRTEGDATEFLERIDRFLAFAVSAGMRPVTMSEVKAQDVGATEVRVLSAA